MNEETGLLGWVLAGVAAVISTLSGLVAMFYRAQVADFRTTETDLKAQYLAVQARAAKCEEDRAELMVKHARLEEKHANLEQRVSDLEINKKNRESL